MAASRLIDVASQLLVQAELPLDRLPYTDAFEEIYKEFKELVGRDLPRHQVWWALLHARKSGRGRTSRRRRGEMSA